MAGAVFALELRLLEAAKVAKRRNFDYFTTTLSISPMKNAAKLNEIGERIRKEEGVSYLLSDFKKKNDIGVGWNFQDCLGFTGRITVAASSPNRRGSAEERNAKSENM